MTEGYERADVAPRYVTWTGIGLLALSAIVALAAGGLIFAFNRHQPPDTRSRLERTAIVPPLPRLQDDPVADATAYQVEMDRMLTTYGWVDRGTGIVRTPIADAMQRLAGAGWPHPTADAGGSPSPAPAAPRDAR